MGKPVNTKLPVRFYDDRGKDKSELILEEILFEDEKVCLCAISMDGDKDGIDEEFKRVLFNKEDGMVLTDNFQYWTAENFETEQAKKAREAVEYVKNAYITRDGENFLMLGNAAELIKKLTGITVKLD